VSTTTPNRGLTKLSAADPDFHSTGWSNDYNAAMDIIDALSAIGAAGADGAIGLKEGTVFITKSASAALLTLAAPVAGLPAAGGDDGKVLRIKSTTAKAHTVTTPSNKIDGITAVATFGGAVTDFIELIAYNGIWRSGASSGIVLS